MGAIRFALVPRFALSMRGAFFASASGRQRFQRLRSALGVGSRVEMARIGDDYEVLENGQVVGCIFRCPSRRKTVPGGGRAATTAKSDALRMEADARSRDGCVREKLAMRELGEGAGRGYSFRRRWRGAVSCTPCNG